MNKKEFIQQEANKNQLRFGRWGSKRKVNSANPMSLLFESPPQNEEEAVQHGNALANTGNYPVGTSGCFNVGISGGCGPGCFVYCKGECDEPQEMTGLSGEELARHHLLYPEEEKPTTPRRMRR